MSYALGQSGGGVQVGASAYRDPILARASLEAAQLLTRSLRRPRSQQASYILRSLGSKYGGKTRAAYEAKRRPRAGDQALYNALRLAIADYYATVGLRYLQERMQAKYGDDFAPSALGALGAVDNTGRDIGCAIGGGATGLLSAIVGVYTAGVGAPLVGAGGQLVMGAAGCGAAQQEAQQSLTAAQAAAAQAELERQQRVATEEAAAAANRTKTIKTVAIVGAAVLGVAVIGYVIVGT